MPEHEQAEGPLKDMLKEYAVKGVERLRVHYDDDEDWYWVGTCGGGMGYTSESRLASGMRKDVAELVLEALLKERANE